MATTGAPSRPLSLDADADVYADGRGNVDRRDRPQLGLPASSRKPMPVTSPIRTPLNRTADPSLRPTPSLGNSTRSGRVRARPPGACSQNKTGKLRRTVREREHSHDNETDPPFHEETSVQANAARPRAPAKVGSDPRVLGRRAPPRFRRWRRSSRRRAAANPVAQRVQRNRGHA